MTLDEAIEYYIKVATQRAIVDEETGENDKWNETKFMTKKENEQIIAENRQLAEWLNELKEAKRLLKAAVEDFAVYGALKDLSAEQRVQNPDWRRFNRVFDALSHQWRYADEALALIGNDIDVPATEGDTNVGRERRIENA